MTNKVKVIATAVMFVGFAGAAAQANEVVCQLPSGGSQRVDSATIANEDYMKYSCTSAGSGSFTVSNSRFSNDDIPVSLASDGDNEYGDVR